MENRNLSINSSWNLALLTSCLCSYRKVQTKEVICKTSTLTFIYQFIIIGISQVTLPVLGNNDKPSFIQLEGT